MTFRGKDYVDGKIDECVEKLDKLIDSLKEWEVKINKNKVNKKMEFNHYSNSIDNLILIH